MERVLSIEGVEDLRGKTVFKGLFGDDLVIVSDEDENPEQFTYDSNSSITYNENAH